LQESLLGFVRLVGSHTGEAMAQEVYAILKEYDIGKKLFCITTDAASNNDTLARALSQILLKEERFYWDPQTKHINCLNHAINLAVQAFLKDLTLVQENPGDDESTSDDDDDDDDEADPEGSAIGLAESFSGVMEKIRGIAKVNP
jgi:hypothetical protein